MPILADMTGLANAIVRELVDKSIVKLYMRYADDTLLLVKDTDINYVQKRLNSFDKNIKFTGDNLPDGKVHFLDIIVDKNDSNIYYKDTHTGQYISFHSQALWRLKTAWIKVLFHRANKVCGGKQAFQQQIDHIKTLMSWNAYPKYVRNSMINRLKSSVNRNDNINNNNKDDRKFIWINLSHLRKKGEQLTNSLIIKLKRSFKENVKFKMVYKTNKLSMFCNAKDSISVEQKSNVFYKITFPGCFQKYVGKTERNVITRPDEHGTNVDQPMYQEFNNFGAFIDHIMLFKLVDAAANATNISKLQF